MKNYFLPMLLSLFFLGACDKNDEIIPEDISVPLKSGRIKY